MVTKQQQHGDLSALDSDVRPSPRSFSTTTLPSIRTLIPRSRSLPRLELLDLDNPTAIVRSSWLIQWFALLILVLLVWYNPKFIYTICIFELVLKNSCVWSLIPWLFICGTVYDYFAYDIVTLYLMMLCLDPWFLACSYVQVMFAVIPQATVNCLIRIFSP